MASSSSSSPTPDAVTAMDEELTLIVKWSGKEYTLRICADDSVAELKRRICFLTNVLPKRQKLLYPKVGNKLSDDSLLLSQIPLKPSLKMTMIGTTEDDIIVDQVTSDDVVDDFELGKEEVVDIEDKEINKQKLRRRIDQYKIKLVNPCRKGKKLLVLDIDYTLFDHRSTAENPLQLMRPYLHEFLTAAYAEYDIIIWSATSMKWVELKMGELGVLNNPNYKITALLDHLAMITVQSDTRGIFDCKPLGLIWALLPELYNAQNTIMFDDLRRNFVMNPQNGLKIRPFRKAHVNRDKDDELVLLTRYLLTIAELDDLSSLDHSRWETFTEDSMIRADAPVMPLETPPRSSEVGEIDTHPPFQSVRAAVSLFRQVSFSKQQPPSLSSSSQDSTDVPDKETQLLLAEQEMNRVHLCRDSSVNAKARALSDLDSAQRKAADLRDKLETTKQSRKCAIQTKHTMNQRLEKLQSQSQETESVRESYILATAELFMAKEKLTEIGQEFSISVEERLSELQRAEEAECSSMVNSQKINDMLKEIAEMRDTAERLNSDADKKKEEEAKINEKSIDAKETYADMKREAEKRLEDLRQDCDPELRKEIDELAEISAENESLQREIKLSRDLKEAKSAMQEIYNEERSYKSLVISLTVELDGMQRENRDLKEKEKDREEVEEGEWVEERLKVEETMRVAERTRQEAEETRMHVDELRREAAATHTVMGEAAKQLEIVRRAVKKAKTAEKRAVEDMTVLTEKKESLTHDDPDKKIRISLKEHEELRGKHEESERMVQYKAETVDAQLEEINESRVEGESMLEEKMKEMEQVKEATDTALRSAEIAEEAHCIVDAELRKWKPEELQ
uniref:protein-serine/threonine phosphatase n=1 Tax=Brassica oleracea var. oleracea TaxID=109376 RepID=A0A0D3A7E2_BRAOL